MAIVANTFTTFDAKGIREDLSNIISRVAREDTPLISNIGKESVSNTFFEWQVDDLATASSTNVQLEGDDIASFEAVTPTVRVGNWTSIGRKTIVITGTHEKVEKAGRKSEMAYQVAKKGLELRRDFEALFTASNVAGTGGTTTTARKTGSLLNWVKTNTSRGAGGADPATTTTPTGVRTDGTQRNITENLFKEVLQKIYSSGGKTDMVMVGPVNKQNISAKFAGVVQNRREAGKGPATIIGAVDFYLGDFGGVSIAPSIYQRERDCWFIDSNELAMATLRPYQVMDLAKTGDADKKLLLMEAGLKVNNEKAHGLLADLTTTLIP